MTGVKCEDGIRNLWPCDLEDVRYIARSYFKNEDIDFEIYGREGNNGKIRKKTFLFVGKTAILMGRPIRRTAIRLATQLEG